MKLFVLGLDYERAPVAHREAFALPPAALHRFYGAWTMATAAACVVLSTCNRTEVIVYGAEQDAALAEHLLTSVSGAAWPAHLAFLHDDEAAVRHVLSVASGLRSLVLGDAQILHQVKEAYRVAVEHDAVNAVLHRLLHTAFRSAKEVRTETSLAHGAASISSRAVMVARDHAPDQQLDGQHVVLVGAGQMALAALNALTSHRLASLTITNRSRERAEALARQHRGQVCAWHDRHTAIARADVVLVASGAREPVVGAEALPPRCRTRSALVIDIAVPRNVEAAVRDLPGYTVLDLDELNADVAAASAARRSALPEAQTIVETHLAEFVIWFFHQQALQPTIQAIRTTFDTIRRQELDRYADQIPAMARADVERLTESIMQKLLAVPIVRLKTTDPNSLDFEQGIKALSAIFAPTDEPSARPEAPREAAGCPFGAGLEVESETAHVHAGAVTPDVMPSTSERMPVDPDQPCMPARCAACRACFDIAALGIGQTPTGNHA
ncbi:MAG: glutamyl-tRNA reductase [Bacteroidota bacterium]